MLLLFDIDGTLVTSGGAGRKALARAFFDITGVDGAMEGVPLGGSTDHAIVSDAFELNVGRKAHDSDEVARIFARYLIHLAEELERARDRYVVLPGALKILTASGGTGRHAVGLATGNVEDGARMKLTPGKLWEHFRFGGYGSDAFARADVVRKGIERGQSYSERTLGRRFEPSEVVVIGDTERDVTAGHAAGAFVVGVLEGSGDRDALIAAKPDLLVETLEDDRLWRFIGLISGT